MVESHYPSTTQLINEQRTRRMVLVVATIVLLVLMFAAIGAISYFVPKAPPFALIGAGVAVFLVVATPVLIWNNPVAGAYLLVGATMFLEFDPRISGSSRLPTSLLPFFLNLNNVGDMFGTGALSPLKFSMAEAVIFLSFLFWLVRGIAKRDIRFEPGLFILPFALYILNVVGGFAHGIGTGADTLMALWEIRSQVHCFIVYLLVSNLITDRSQIAPILWMAVLGIGCRGLMGIYSYILKGGVVDDQGILQHEDSLFFNMFFFFLIIGGALKIDKKLLRTAWAFLPFVLFSTLMNQRRAGTGSFIIAFIALMPIMYALLENRRQQIGRFGIAFAVLAAIYLPAAWNSEGAWAQPARAIRSASSPDSRDQASDDYRKMENYDLEATRDTSPIFGIGYGKPFLQPFALPRVASTFQSFLPHNSILWVWMRLGHVGFFCFMMLLITGIIKTLQLLKHTTDTDLLMVGLLFVAAVFVVFVYGKYDLQFSNTRTMTMFTILMGLTSFLKRDKAIQERLANQ